MKKLSIALSFATVLLFSCAGDSTSNNNNEVVEEINTNPTPCECQQAIKAEGKNSNIYKICQDKRQDKEFSEEFNKCQYADLTGKNVDDIVLPTERQPSLTTPANGDYSLDTEISDIKWVGKKVIGESHYGNIGVKSGSISINDGTISSGNITIDMTSISVASIEDEEKKGKLAGHLKADDFFDVANHNEASFNFTNVTQEGNKLNIEGQLTIKGKTETANTILVMSGTGEDGLVATGALSFDRTKFGVNFNSGSVFSDLKDNIIEDDITLTFSLRATKK